jgi:hypothetical protein
MLRREIFTGGYIDDMGLVSPGAYKAKESGITYTAEFVIVLSRLNQLTMAIKDYWTSQMATVKVRESISIRDYYGVLAAAKVCSPAVAKIFLKHKALRLGNLDTQAFTFVAQALMAAGYPVGIFRLFFITTLLYHVFRDVPVANYDARRHGWLLIQTWDGKGLLSKWAVDRWKAKLLREYPNGMKDVYGSYYQSEHPFLTYVPIF